MKTKAYFNDLMKRFKWFGITIISDNTKSEFNECYYEFERYEYPVCESVEDLISFCIEYKTKTIYVEPVSFDYKYFCNAIKEDYSEFVLKMCFDREIELLRKAFSYIDNSISV